MTSWQKNTPRWQYVGFIILLSLFTSTMALMFLWSQVQARGIASGAGNCGTFEQAIQLAEDGDFIPQMIPAKDSGNAVITKNLRLSGGWFPDTNCDTNNQEFTETIDFLSHGFSYHAPITRSELNNSGSVLVLEDTNDPTFPNLDKLIVEHFILETNGNPTNGGGVRGVISDSAEVLLDNIFFDDNFVRDYGGGIYLEIRGGSHLQIEDSLFDFNEADDFNGGGLYIELYNNSSLTIDNSVFTNNSANRGGGFEVHLFDDSELIIRNSEFEDNRTMLVSQSAGGGYIQMEGGRVTIENSKFTTNNTGQNGGGLYLNMIGGEVQINNTVFDGNLADNQPDSKGGGLYAEMDGGNISILGGAFRNNTASGSGGGLYVASVGSNNTTVRISGTYFNNNSPNNYQFVQSGSGTLTSSVLDNTVYLPSILNNTDSTIKSAEILSLTLDANFNYVVNFEVHNFVPDTKNYHVHFFFDTVLPKYAGTELCPYPSDPTQCKWKLYGGSSPFTKYSFSERPFGPYGAEKMCILVADSQHRILLNSGNCVKLP
ncbi:MAG: hypothetical protein GY796_09250 [Chloroflexi bacterium]|nr:hypothetical protein [Chloroflexota bacterium]